MAADARVAPIKSFAFIVALSAHDCHLPQQTAMRGQVKETYNNAENENPTHAPDQDEMKALKKKKKPFSFQVIENRQHNVIIAFMCLSFRI